MEVKEHYQVMQMVDTTQPTTYTGLDCQVAEAMRKVREVKYLYVCSIMLISERLQTNTGLPMGSLCYTLYSWFSLIRQIMFAAVSRAPILIMMS